MKLVMIAAGAALLLLTSCGGGTVGTSPTDESSVKVVQGVVMDSSGLPVAGAIVQLEGAGESVSTNQLGRFVMSAEISAGQASLLVGKDGNDAVIGLNNLTGQRSIVGVQVQLNGAASSSSSVELIVDAIDGSGCEDAWGDSQVVSFGPGTPPLVIIDQTRDLPENTVCTVHLRLFQDGEAQEGLGFQLLHVLPSADGFYGSRIEEVSAQGETDAAGTGALSFPLERDMTGMGYYVLEAPTGEPAEGRVGIVINPLMVEELR